jgi:hypothetical protein
MDIFDKPSGPPSKDQFAKLLMDAIHKAGETGEITYEQEEFRLRGEGEKGSIIFLSNAHQEYCSAPAEQREKILKRCVRNWFVHLRQMPEEFEDAILAGYIREVHASTGDKSAGSRRFHHLTARRSTPVARCL